MRYWVYINDKVDGPYDETNLVTLQGFTPDTLICSEEVASNGGQEWVKASSVFEFDEVPVNEPTEQQPQPAVQPSNDETQALLAKLELLTSGMSNLQSKLDSMQHNLDHALEQNQKLADQVALLSHPTDAGTVPAMSSDDPHTNTITLTRHDMSSAQEEKSPSNETAFPAQAAPEEEEVIIRSALDSLYGGKPVEVEDTFQDLMPEKTAEQEARKAAEEEQAVRNIEPELEFIPLQEENKAPAEEAAPAPEQPQPAPATKPQIEETAEPLPAEALDEIEKELTSLSLGDSPETQPAPQEPAEQEAAQEPEVKEAIITTPGVEETAKDALINELTASPKEDILDQIIAQHQQEQTPADQAEESQKGEIALGVAAAGLAAASVVSLVDNAEEKPMAIATDKEHPEQLEKVLPAEQMPEDVPATKPEPADLPSVEETPVVEQPQPEPAAPEAAPQIPVADMPQEMEQPQEPEQTTPEIPVASTPDELPQPAEETPAAAADLPGLEDQASIEAAVQQQAAAEPSPVQEEEIIEELVPNAQQAEPEGFYVKEEPQETPAQESDQPSEQPQEEAVAQTEQAEEPAAQNEEAPVAQTEEPAAQAAEQPVEENPADMPQTPAQEEKATATGAITDKDLQDAFGADNTEPVVESSTVNVTNEVLPEGNPNELTEIELKEGSTYLISDFVPPAQLTDNVAEVMKAKEEEEKKDKKQETIFQDMLAAVTKSQSTKALSTDGLPDDLAATQVNLENTIQAKRGATLDIKTVPMVPEPGSTERLDVNELNDVTAQHGLKTSGGLTKSTKTVIMALVGVLLLIILYALLGLMKLLPASVNLFAAKQQAPVAEQTTQEMLNEAPAVPAAPEVPQGPTPAEQAQEKVQNFPLPNGYLLKGFIESKHATISPELITWETTEAVEADNYSVTVKVPPENPQNFKTVYRFNYNMLSGLLDPTVSDAKNLLDQAYGIKPAAPAAAKKSAPAIKIATTRKGTSRRFN